jgi:hypothetical protein
MAAENAMKIEQQAGPAATARRTVLDQHVELRRLLKMGMAQAHAAVKGQTLAHEPLRSLVTLVRDVFVRHLADEEGLILPLLNDDLPLGPLRAKRLREEHAGQRAELEALCSWPEEESDLELALRFEGLGAALLDDIAHEERHLLTPEIIRDDCVVIDQSGG